MLLALALLLSPMTQADEDEEPAYEAPILQSFRGDVSAYCLRGRTASGVQTQPGVVAAGGHLAFGTHLWIDGIGEGIVLDRGSEIWGNRIDIWLSSCQDAINFGRQSRLVTILD